MSNLINNKIKLTIRSRLVWFFAQNRTQLALFVRQTRISTLSLFLDVQKPLIDLLVVSAVVEESREWPSPLFVV